MAMRASVTVSMAADKSGTRREMFFVKLLDVSTDEGTTSVELRQEQDVVVGEAGEAERIVC